MGLINSSVWLKRLYEVSAESEPLNVIKFSKLMEHFPDWSKEEWLHYLYTQGMLPISKDTQDIWRKWQSNNPVLGLSKIFQQCKEYLKGPDVDIFLFPINENSHWLMEGMGGKNGITFPNVMFLFFHGEVTQKEKQALMIHEYHHICRLHHHGHTEDSVSLLESIVMEGLAEWEVKKQIGSEYLAPWVKLYSNEFLWKWWERVIQEKITLRGRKRHTAYMYGGKYGFPKWLGYNIGFRMVESFAEKNDNLNSLELVQMPAEKILHESFFSDR
ncbi:DUF2268 domain-containing protein [Evansella tamaricis]|uniref:DUF2268 domain-containing protein n=1 Tax=Evansella tamaricis TaxID=2069301 RepID=A0ABS6JHW7_9BACI|nr:DUF2268 domain-containing putative Zn-dependent protease [Evansella tamaricis]MBU9713264.1 DUF2268 domain-containing protein [Evansella tamaricis]